MKKLLVVLLICSIAFGAFAQVNIGGSIRAFGGFSTAEKGYYGMADGLGIKNDGSRFNFSADMDGKAGMSADLRFSPDSAYINSFWAWAKPADWIKINLGWFDFGDYVIKDSTQTVKFGGNIRNTSKLDPLGGSVKFGAFGQFLLLENKLNIGVGLFSDKSGAETMLKDMTAYAAVMYSFPNVGKLVVDASIPTSTKASNETYVTGAFQFTHKLIDFGVGVKYIGKGLNPNREFFGMTTTTVPGKPATSTSFETKASEKDIPYKNDNFGAMLLLSVKPIEKLFINLGAEVYFGNAIGVTDSLSIAYDFGPIKPVFYTYGALTTDKEKLPLKAAQKDSTSAFQFTQVFGAELNIPVKFGKGSFLAAGVAYDTGVAAFQVPVFFRLFF